MATLFKMKQKQKLMVLFICFFIAFLVQPAAAQDKVKLSQLDSYFETARQEWKIPGMAVAIVKDGKVVLAKGYGVKEFSKQEKVDENTLFAIASNTKSFTAAALAILVDEGKIRWDDKVRDYLPYFKLYDLYVSEEMTIRDLLCHRSGLKTYSGDLLWYETSYSTVEIIKRARFLKPSFGFRAGYGYSNIMFMVAGEVVAAVTGKPWKDFVKERILQPLGMNTTNMGVTGLKKYNNAAVAHYVYPDGKTMIVPYTTSDNTGGAGSINSNVMEMTQWIKLLLNNGVFDNQRILSESGIWEMWSPHTVNQVSPFAKRLFPNTHFRAYGLGWSLYDYHGYKVIGHGGGLDGMVSRVVLVPEIKLGVVILSNSINRLPDALVYKIMDTYLEVKPQDWSRIFLDQYRDFVRREIQRGFDATQKHGNGSHAEVTLEDYTGLYEDSMYGDAKVTLQEGKLALEFLPTSVFTSDLAHLHYDTFVLKLRNFLSYIPHGTGTVRFIRDHQGNVVEMRLYIPNRDFWFDELEYKKKKTQ